MLEIKLDEKIEMDNYRDTLVYALIEDGMLFEDICEVFNLTYKMYIIIINDIRHKKIKQLLKNG